MIISCEKCDTKYRLDASRLSHASVKVQCSKCDHIFIVPATGVERNKRKPENNAPHENNQVKEETKGPPEDPWAGFDTRPDDSGTVPAEDKKHEEQDREKNIDTSGGVDVEDKRDRWDISFEADPTTARESETEAKDEAEDITGKMNEPSYEPWNGPQQSENKDEENAHGTPEQAKPATEESKEAPLPWEVSANTFDLSFGADAYKPQNDEAGGADDEPSEEEGTAPVDLNGVDDEDVPPDNGGEGVEKTVREEKVESVPESKEEAVDVNGPIDTGGSDEVPGPSNKESESFPSFSEELIKAASNAEKALDDYTETADDATLPGQTFSSPHTPAEPEAEVIKKSGISTVIAIIVIIIAMAGGVIYLKTRPQSSLMTEPSGETPLRIESAKGYYVVNKDGEKIFVIMTKIKNLTDGPVKISGIRGLVMDSSGHEMARKKVSPGRVVTAQDLRNLPLETLLRSFRDTSASTMPKRSTIPTMILFTDLNKAVAEYGIDVLR